MRGGRGAASHSCRKLLKTEGFERVSETNDVKFPMACLPVGRGHKKQSPPKAVICFDPS